MFERLYGPTEEDQLLFLKNRSLITLISILLMLIPFTAAYGTLIFGVLVFFIWGWSAVKAFFGIASLGAIFSGNVIIGSVIFLIYIMIAGVAGYVNAALGIGRYIYLVVKRRSGGK
ncbi:MAG: hypothetical protein ACI4L5_05330 [Negativibacillus sp.]